MSLFTGLLDARVAIAEMAITDAPSGAMPEEEQAVAHAVARRRREFLTGRICARKALAEIGGPAVALPSGLDRMPVWPQDYVGSITHTNRDCAAAVASRDTGILSIGIDLEPAEALPADLWETVCSADERAWLSTHPEPQRGILARAIFSAKECAFKCQFPLTRQMLEFHEVGLTLDLANGTFTAQFHHAVRPRPTAVGKLRITAQHIASAMTLAD